jgi:DNA repair ATPase RecN
VIKKIVLQNFQSHKNSILKLSRGINIIVGESDCGKTAIVRALNWITNNRPSSDAIRKNGSERTKVKIIVDDNKVERIKSKRENAYVVDGVEYKSIGTSVPEKVKEVLNLDDTNFQFQMDSPFLLSSSAGQRSEVLNRAAGLHEMDQVLSRLNSAARLIERLTQEVIKDSNNSNCAYSRYKPVKKAIKLLDRAEALEERKNALNRQLARLQTQIISYKSARTRLKGVYELLKNSEALISNFLDPLECSILEHQRISALRADLEGKILALRDNLEASNLLELDLKKINQKIESLQDRIKLCPTCGKPL